MCEFVYSSSRILQVQVVGVWRVTERKAKNGTREKLERTVVSFQNFPEFRVCSTEKGNHFNFFLAIPSELGSNLFPVYMRENHKDWRGEKTNWMA